MGKKIIPERTPVSEQPPAERIHNYKEVSLGYSADEARQEAARCLACANPACMKGCPVNVDIPAFLKLVESGDFRGAYNVIRQTNVLPAITGRVCPQENQCEGACVLSKKYEAVSIGRLERFVADWSARNNGKSEFSELPRKTGKKAAVVGAGPAGLTVAADLAKLGHLVTIFEALHEAGGVLVYGIPEFRLPKSIVQREVDHVKKLGVEIRTDFVVGNAASLDELLADFDVIFLGNGAGLPTFLGIPGEDLGGVYSSNEYLTRANLMKAYRFPIYDTPIARGKHVITIGGGNTAMDASRIALRLGAEESSIVYRRSISELPARVEEVHHAQEEGVKFSLLTTPLAFYGENGRLKGLECIKNELGEADASGRRRPVPIEGSNFRIEADVAIVAVGQSPSPLISKTTPDLETNRWGVVVVDKETMKTSKKGVFAGGDVVTGGATVILAMGQGKIAAREMDKYLKTGEW